MASHQKTVTLMKHVFYNPKYNEDGTVPQFFMNSNLGKIFNKFLELFYNLRSPQGIGLIVLPLTMLIPFISKNLVQNDSYLYLYFCS